LHNALIFKKVVRLKQEKVSYEYSKGIIKFYTRGIGILPEGLIDKDWEQCFFNSKDAMTAYYLYDAYLDNKVRKGFKYAENWIKEDYLILIQVYDQINKKEKQERENFVKEHYTF
jgi:hypothetical protein